MARRDILPPNLPPRLLTREQAATYICVSPNTFDKMVAQGSMPPAKRLGDRRIAWDRHELDGAIDRLAVEEPAGEDTTWSDINAS